MGSRHSQLVGAELHIGRTQVSTGDPNGVVTAGIIGEFYWDSTDNHLYIAEATDNSSWADADAATDTLAEILAIGNTSGGNDIVMSIGDDISLLGGLIDLAEIVTPANPAADTGRLYVEDVASVTSLFFRDSAGTAINISSLAATSGDVNGPASSVDNSVPTFDSTTGKLIQDPNTMFITDTGEVGIGTASPQQKLHVNAGGANDLLYGLQIMNTSGVESGGSAIGVLFSVESVGTFGKGAIAYERLATFGRGSIHFLQDSVADTNNPVLADSVMTIQNDGRVGVGNTSPGEMFHVDVTGDSVYSVSTEQGLLVSRNVNPRIIMEDTSEAVNVKGMAFELAGSVLKILALNDSGGVPLNNIMTWARAGNVGIGTDSPQQSLHVNVSGGSTFTSAQNQGILITRSTAPRFAFENTGLGADLKIMAAEYSSEALQFFSMNDAGNSVTLSNVLSMHREGRVAIGRFPDNPGLLTLFNPDQSDGDILLQFDTPRPWMFMQSGTGAGTSLVLKPESANKQLRITDELNNNVVTFNGDSTNLSNNFFRVDQSWRRKRVTTAVSANTAAMGQASIYVVTDTTADRTITISTNDIVGSLGREFIIKDESGALFSNGTTITIDTEGSETIDGNASVEITADYGVVRLYSDNADLFSM